MAEFINLILVWEKFYAFFILVEKALLKGCDFSFNPAAETT